MPADTETAKQSEVNTSVEVEPARESVIPTIPPEVADEGITVVSPPTVPTGIHVKPTKDAVSPVSIVSTVPRPKGVTNDLTRGPIWLATRREMLESRKPLEKAA